jgi:hypothetical protein
VQFKNKYTVFYCHDYLSVYCTPTDACLRESYVMLRKCGRGRFPKRLLGRNTALFAMDSSLREGPRWCPSIDVASVYFCALHLTGDYDMIFLNIFDIWRM